MAKKSSSKGSSKSSKSEMSAEDHRNMARQLNARASLHHAKAELAEAKNPPKKPKYGVRGYPC